MAERSPGFVWGVATSAFQIEGARDLDGKGPSIWDVFADAGRVPDIELTGCDHYHRYQEDLDLLDDLGVHGYRFSIAWSRVLPAGDGPINEPGLRFYEQLVDGMLSRGITPYVTLYHWDLPQALQDKGGWANRETVEVFTRYARIVVERLGDRVQNWITHNEPWVATMLGHQEGVFAPGIADWPTALRAGHHILLSHGRAAEVIRSASSVNQVGIALDCRPAQPASDRSEDVAATRHFDGFRNRWFFEPVFGMGYPEDMVASYRDGGRLPGGLESIVAPGDLEAIAAPLDFLGVNYYTTIDVAAGNEESEASDVSPGSDPPEGYTEMGWRIDPVGLEDFLVRVAETYAPPSVLVTENGASYSDGPDESGVVNDDRRIGYLEGHVAAVQRAGERGAPVHGYFVWSLLDNLEWVHGYRQRFGLVWVDHRDGTRIPKQSYHWYRDRISDRPSGPSPNY